MAKEQREKNSHRLLDGDRATKRKENSHTNIEQSKDRHTHNLSTTKYCLQTLCQNILLANFLSHVLCLFASLFLPLHACTHSNFPYV